MELGIGMFGDLQINATGEIQPAQQRLQEIIEEIKLMDEVGLDFYGIGEHHRPDYAVSSPEIILAAAATVTKNIKLSSAVSVLSSSDPVKLYQNLVPHKIYPTCLDSCNNLLHANNNSARFE